MDRRLGAAAAVVALLAALTGCGSQQADTDSGSGAAVTVRQLTATDFGKTVAAAQKSSRSAHLEGTVSNNGTTMTMSADVAVGTSLDDLAMSMAMELDPQHQISMVLVNRAIYVKASGTGLTHNQAKPWVEIDLDDPTNPFGAMFSQILSSLDPDHLARLYSSVKRLHDLGVETVDGVLARHYTVTVDTRRVITVMGLDKLPGVTRAKLMANLPDEVTTEMWVDSQNRPVKSRSDVNGAVNELTYSGWGRPVTVKAPPQSQVVPFDQIDN